MKSPNKKLSTSFKEKYSDINWNDIIGFRNRIVHEYGKTDYTIIYEVVSNDIPNLKDTLFKKNNLKYIIILVFIIIIFYHF